MVVLVIRTEKVKRCLENITMQLSCVGKQPQGKVYKDGISLVTAERGNDELRIPEGKKGGRSLEFFRASQTVFGQGLNL